MTDPSLFSTLQPKPGDWVRVAGHVTRCESLRTDPAFRSAAAPKGWAVCLTPWLSIRDRWYKIEDIEVLPGPTSHN